MNNFFFDTSDYSLFKKALKATENEPVVINILSTDSSLQKNDKKSSEQAASRKNMSRKYEPSPFGKFFGPRKQQAVSVDMKDFSSWKNKNYRRAEESINDETSETTKFSLTDYMNQRSQNKFTEMDQAKTDLQKPINQLSTDDPMYKRFSLDSYMSKLEEQIKTKDEFEQNDDILEPLGDSTQSVVPDSSQDENFGFGSNVSIEKVALDEDISGDTFKFEQEELDKFRARLDKIEREAANIKEKTNEKVIGSGDLSELGGFNLDNLTDEEDSSAPKDGLVDDIESINEKLTLGEDISEEKKDTPNVVGKRFIEINKTEPTLKKKRQSESTNLIDAFDDVDDSNIDETDVNEIDSNEELSDGVVEELPTEEQLDEDLIDAVDESDGIGELSDLDSDLDIDEELDIAEPIPQAEGEDFGESSVSKPTKIKRSDIVTKDDLKSMTDELVGKFTELYKKDGNAAQVSGDASQIQDPYAIQGGEQGAEQPYIYPGTGFVPQETYGVVGGSQTQQLQAQLQELINTNKMLDLEKEERLRQAELEKERVAAEYEARIKEMEQSFKQNYEDFKKQAYLDKLDRDIKLKEAESKFKKKTVEIKEKEKESYSKERTGAMLRKELKSHLNISNLEMDKKLLEIASHLNKAENEKLNAEKLEMARKLEAEEIRAKEVEEASDIDDEEIIEDEEEEEVEETPKKKTTRKTTRKRKTTTPRTSSARRGARKGSRRKIDSDIIGGIDFE